MWSSQLLLTALSVSAALGGLDEETIEFEHGPVGRGLRLPADPWQPLGSELHLAGHRFVLDWGLNGQELGFDTNADGTVDAVLGDERRSVELVVERAEDEPFRYRLDVEPRGSGWFWKPAGCRTARRGDAEISLFDLNGDGDFTDVGIDAVAVDSASAALLSRVISIRGELLELDLREDASAATLRPFDGPRARLDVTSAYFAEGRLVYAVFASDAGYSFDFAAGCGGLDVPAGTYRFVSGRVESRVESARIAPGRMSPVELGPDESHVIEWGGPVCVEFEIRRCSRRVTILPDVRFYGQAGEEVLAFQPNAGAPRIEVRDAGTGGLLEYGKLGGCCGGGLSACKFEVPADVAVEVRLIHDRRLFGRMVGSAR